MTQCRAMGIACELTLLDLRRMSFILGLQPLRCNTSGSPLCSNLGYRFQCICRWHMATSSDLATGNHTFRIVLIAMRVAASKTREGYCSQIGCSGLWTASASCAGRRHQQQSMATFSTELNFIVRRSSEEESAEYRTHTTRAFFSFL